jgi:outer membrane translocation and assembly module TamA
VLTNDLTLIQTNYTITGETTDTETSEYLKKILKERIKEKTKTLTSETKEDLNQQVFIQQSVLSDLLKALYAKGYYNAKIEYQNSDKAFSGTYHIDYGPQFRITTIEVQPTTFQQFHDKKELAIGNPLDAETILTAKSHLYNRVQNEHCFLDLSAQDEVLLNRLRHTGDVRFLLKTSQ